ncbi:hypothetical protein [Paenibacillus sp. UNC451MF]|uniref:hypothetical protein n=1 Tax=Paenibacillus sp. UNC451MF TaxID=1449063 RepID=UPI00048E6B39|nr:hypothetical protein [Paenibacillus sp. UNC451MF]
MEPVQRTEREITYHVGWKRGKITPNQGKHLSADITHDVNDSIAGADVFGLNLRYLWRRAGTVNERMLWIVLPILPLLVFALSLWLVYRLAIQPY